MPVGFFLSRFNPGPQIRQLSTEVLVWRDGAVEPRQVSQPGGWVVSSAQQLPERVRDDEADSMHLTVSGTPLRESDVLALAKRTGTLAWTAVTDPARLSDWGATGYGDPVADWYDLIASLRLMRLLHTYLESRAQEDLDGFYEDADQVWNAHWTQTTHRGWAERLASYAQLRCADLAQGQEYFRIRLNAMLQETTLVQYEPWPPRLTLSALGVAGVAVVAFARSLTGETGSERQCPGCGRRFMARHGSSRHCSDSCKTKAYRKRKGLN